MKGFRVTIQEILSRTITIKAESSDDAIKRISEEYKKEAIVLDAGDCIDTEFMAEPVLENYKGY